MELFINESLGLYPRHPGDIKLIDRSWEPGKPLPEGWEEVIATQPPTVESDEIWEEIPPAKIDGVWHRQFSVRKLTEEEIAQIKTIIRPEVE